MISPIGIFEWMKANPKEARFIILMLLEDDVVTIVIANSLDAILIVNFK